MRATQPNARPGPHDDQRTGKAAGHQRQAQRRHLLMQEERGQHRHQHRRQHAHGGELGHRHVADADEEQCARRQQQRAAQELEAWVRAAKEVAAAAQQAQRQPAAHQQRLHRITREEAHDDGQHLAEVLRGGVERDEPQAHHQDEADAGKRPVPRRGQVRGHRAHGRCTREASASHTGVRRAGSAGSVPRSMWLSSGLWKSEPREASRPCASARSA